MVFSPASSTSFFAVTYLLCEALHVVLLSVLTVPALAAAWPAVLLVVVFLLCISSVVICYWWTSTAEGARCSFALLLCLEVELADVVLATSLLCSCPAPHPRLCWWPAALVIFLQRGGPVC